MLQFYLKSLSGNQTELSWMRATVVRTGSLGWSLKLSHITALWSIVQIMQRKWFSGIARGAMARIVRMTIDRCDLLAAETDKHIALVATSAFSATWIDYKTNNASFSRTASKEVCSDNSARKKFDFDPQSNVPRAAVVSDCASAELETTSFGGANGRVALAAHLRYGFANTRIQNLEVSNLPQATVRVRLYPSTFSLHF
jgi:hypothetical protein